MKGALRGLQDNINHFALEYRKLSDAETQHLI